MATPPKRTSSCTGPSSPSSKRTTTSVGYFPKLSATRLPCSDTILAPSGFRSSKSPLLGRYSCANLWYLFPILSRPPMVPTTINRKWRIFLLMRAVGLKWGEKLGLRSPSTASLWLKWKGLGYRKWDNEDSRRIARPGGRLIPLRSQSKTLYVLKRN